MPLRKPCEANKADSVSKGLNCLHVQAVFFISGFLVYTGIGVKSNDFDAWIPGTGDQAKIL